MKKVYFTLSALLLLGNILSAKTYTLGSGKWTEASYPGTIIKADDLVIVTGQITLNTGIVVEGTLQVEKGASMVGMKDLVISKSGTFVNNGNTVTKRIVNEGTINNNLIMEAMNDIDNKGIIGNNNNLVAGNNFNNFGGDAQGKSGAYFINNNLHTSHGSTFGTDVRVLVGNDLETAEKGTDVKSPFIIDATLISNSVVLSIANPKNMEVALYSIEKSTDGKSFTLLDMVRSKNSQTTVSYTDENLSKEMTYYRIKAINNIGEETALPMASIKGGTDIAYIGR